MENKIKIERKKYEDLLNELSKDISLLQLCYISLQFVDDGYEETSSEYETAASSVYLGKAINRLKNFEKEFRNIEP